MRPRASSLAFLHAVMKSERRERRKTSDISNASYDVNEAIQSIMMSGMNITQNTLSQRSETGSGTSNMETSHKSEKIGERRENRRSRASK